MSMDWTPEDEALSSSNDELEEGGIEVNGTRGAYDNDYLLKAVHLFCIDVLKTVEPFASNRYHPEIIRILRFVAQEASKIREIVEPNHEPTANLSPVEWNNAEIDLLFELAKEKAVVEKAAALQAGGKEWKELGIGQKISKLNHLATELKLINRFVDRRQPIVPSYPRNKERLSALGNMNPTILPIWQESVFRKLFVRLLHLPGIITNKQHLRPGEQNRIIFSYFWQFSKLLTIAEIELHPPNKDDEYQTISNFTWFQWIPELRQRLAEYITCLKDIVMENGLSDDPDTGRVVTLGDIRQHVLRQLETPRVMLEMQQVNNEFLNENPLPRLMLDLISREYDFELALSEDHVEDKLFNKQVMTWAEKQFTDEYSWHFVDYTLDADDYNGVKYQNYQHGWRKLVRDTTQFNRQRYAHRLLLDWRGHRPWRKIYQLYDTESPEHQWLKGAIRKFRTETLAFPDDDSPLAPFGDATANPSDARRKAAKLLGIHPIDFQEEDSLRQPIIEAGNFVLPKACTVCKKTFTPGSTVESTVIHTHCNHLFHLKCIFEFWDSPGRYLHSCPDCGAAPLLNWQQVGIDLQQKKIKDEWAHNLFGYETEDMNATAKSRRKQERALYDVPEPERPATVAEALAGPKGYWLRENLNTLMLLSQKNNEEALNWDEFHLGKAGKFNKPYKLRSKKIATRNNTPGDGEPYVPFEEPILYRPGGEEDDDIRNMLVGGMDHSEGTTDGTNHRHFGIRADNSRWENLHRIAQLWEVIPNIGRIEFPTMRFRFPDAQRARNQQRIGEILYNERPEVSEEERGRERFRLANGSFILPGARYPVEQERAYLRMKRRRRNADARQKMKKEKRGLFGLQSTGI